jgi:hypothetical protein
MSLIFFRKKKTYLTFRLNIFLTYYVYNRYLLIRYQIKTFIQSNKRILKKPNDLVLHENYATFGIQS